MSVDDYLRSLERNAASDPEDCNKKKELEATKKRIPAAPLVVGEWTREEIDGVYWWVRRNSPNGFKAQTNPPKEVLYHILGPDLYKKCVGNEFADCGWRLIKPDDQVGGENAN